MVCNSYDDNVHDYAPVGAGSGVYSLVEDNKDRNFGDNPLSNNANGHASLYLLYGY